jgi:hypothetical protein
MIGRLLRYLFTPRDMGGNEVGGGAVLGASFGHTAAGVGMGALMREQDVVQQPSEDEPGFLGDDK